MSKCSDCIHYDVCELKRNHYYLGQPIGKVENAEIACSHFKLKDGWIELPCSLGDTLWCDGKYFASYCAGKLHSFKVNEIVTEVRNYFRDSVDYCFDFDAFGKTVFTTREEAERKLGIK